MAMIADDVIGGFNSFIKEQQLDATRLLMTLVQFDSQDPHEVVFAGVDIRDVPPLTAKTFQPRSRTPLLDALGSIIAMAEEARHGGERLVVVTFSDGKENASREHTKRSLFSSIETKRRAGWTFVFMGANQDSYAEGGGLGFADKNMQNWAFDKVGTRAAFTSVSGAVSSMKSKLQKRAAYDSEDFFEGVKDAEADFDARSEPTKSSMGTLGDLWSSLSGSARRAGHAVGLDL